MVESSLNWTPVELELNSKTPKKPYSFVGQVLECGLDPN